MNMNMTEEYSISTIKYVTGVKGLRGEGTNSLLISIQNYTTTNSTIDCILVCDPVLC